MSYRKFRLVNSSNVSYDLSTPSTERAMIDPSDLGFTRDVTVLRTGNQSEVTASVYSFNSFTFKVVFFNTTNIGKYQAYDNFVSFLGEDDLTLIYELPNQTIFSRSVYPTGLTKTEVDSSSSALECTLTLAPLGLWEDGTEVTKTISGSTTITCTSVVDTPLTIEITATSVSYPYLTIADSNGTVYGAMKFKGTFSYVYVDSDDLSQSIVLKNVGGTTLTNPTKYQDRTVGSKKNKRTITFLKMRKGTNTLTFSSTAEEDCVVTVSYKNRYATV